MVIVLIQEKNHVFIILISDKNRYISPMAATVGKGTLDVQKKWIFANLLYHEFENT